MLHDIGVFILIVLFVLLMIGAAVGGWNEGVEEARLKEEKHRLEEQAKENQELINKALKHYAETNGVK
jgi:hypothetical protein